MRLVRTAAQALDSAAHELANTAIHLILIMKMTNEQQQLLNNRALSIENNQKANFV